ncbi:MAG: glycosyltransferase family A protein, partial [Burkholderiaceae bacterium]
MQFTTLVPAYKPKYLVELLTALRHQTVKPARVIISDDSPDQAFIAALNSEPIRSTVADLNIEVVPGPRSGAYNNFRHLLQLYGGQTELFHLLLDDDIPYPSFYERHLQAHSQATVQCVVSRRWTALESGLPMRDLPVPEALSTHPQRLLALDAPMLFAHTAGLSRNWLGEFSNATFRAGMAPALDDPSL